MLIKISMLLDITKNNLKKLLCLNYHFKVIAINNMNLQYT